MGRTIIGIIGAVGSGKDTCGDYLSKTHKFQKTAFAKKVKDVAAIVFGWDREMMEGITPQSREWREKVDPYWDISPRQAMQKIGTDMFRTHIDAAVWVKAVVKEISAAPAVNYVVTDCRFENEIAALKALGGTIIYIERGTAVAPEAVMHISDSNSYTLRTLADIHISNNGSLDDLYKALDAALKTL
jgi:hypothetical protein